MNSELKLVFLHCIIHQNVLCKSVLKQNHVTDVVTKTFNVIRTSALNHRLNMVTKAIIQLSGGSAWVRCLKEYGT